MGTYGSGVYGAGVYGEGEAESGSTVPWIGAELVAPEAGRWWDGNFDGPADQFVQLKRVTSSRIARPLTVGHGGTTQPLNRVTRTSTAQPLTVDAQPPLEYYPDEILASEAAIYWRLEASGSATDYSGNNRHGIMENWEAGDEQFYTPEMVSGIIGNGARFRESDFAYYDADDYAATVDYSIEIWFKSTQTTTGTRTITRVGNQKGLGLQTTSGTAYVYGMFGQTTRVDMVPLSTVNDGDWHQFVLTRAVNTIRFYVDAAQVYTTTASAYTPSSSSTIYTGAWNYDEPLPDLDELSYYTGRALTQTEISRHYNSAIQLGNPPLHQTITLGRATRNGLAQPLNAAYARTVAIGRASRSSTAKVLTPDQGMPPGSPQVISIGRATRTSTARALSLHITIAQTVVIGRAIRVSTARPLTFSSGVIYSDAFNRANGQVGTPDVGGPYSFQFGIASNYVVDSNALAVNTNGSLNLIVPAAVDFDMSATIRQVGGGSTAMIFRVSSSTSYWAVRWTVSSLTLLRKTTNIETAIGSYPVNLGAGDVVRAEARGKIINVYLNGRLLFVAEDQFTPTADVGFSWVNDMASRIEEVVVKQVLPVTSPIGDLLDAELALMLAEQSNEGLLFKGRDSYRADEGLMA